LRAAGDLPPHNFVCDSISLAIPSRRVSKIRDSWEVAMICRHVSLLIIFSLLMVALVGPVVRAAQQTPAPRVVDLSAPDGVILKATFFAAAQPGPGVLLLHQCNRQRKVWDNLAGRLADSGINVMTVDFRGYGESGGKGPDKVSSVQEADQIVKEQWPADIDVAFRYLQTQPSVNRGVIGAGGASCGVNQAVQLARRHPEVKSLVLLSETTDRSGRQFLHNSPNLPLFLAAADDDFNDPGVVEIMQWLYDVSPDPANKFVRYSTGGHGVDMFAAHPELPGMIVDWFNATLRNSPAPPATHALSPWSAESRFLALADEPDGMRKAEQMFANERRADPSVVLFSEALINRFGYEHLAMGDTKVAIELFQMNVTAYPNSPNVYDSLGDAYLAAGQKDLARQNAQKALELLATDTADSPQRRDGIRGSAEQKLKQLGNTQ
jgi:dienelactone hydrolase